MHATALIMSLKYHSLSVPLAFSRAPICFTGASPFAFTHREPSLWFVSIMSDLQPGSHHALTASLLAACCTRGEYWAEEAGGNFCYVALRRNIHF